MKPVAAEGLNSEGVSEARVTYRPVTVTEGGADDAVTRLLMVGTASVLDWWGRKRGRCSK